MDEEENKENQDNQTNQANQSNYLAPNLTQLSFKGSIGSLFNGDSSLFYHQFELYAREQKWIQVALIQDAIYRIKENFNKEFPRHGSTSKEDLEKFYQESKDHVEWDGEKFVPKPLQLGKSIW